MDSLPLEMIRLIFNYLPLESKIRSREISGIYSKMGLESYREVKGVRICHIDIPVRASPNDERPVFEKRIILEECERNMDGEWRIRTSNEYVYLRGDNYDSIVITFPNLELLCIEPHPARDSGSSKLNLDLLHRLPLREITIPRHILTGQEEGACRLISHVLATGAQLDIAYKNFFRIMFNAKLEDSESDELYTNTAEYNVYTNFYCGTNKVVVLDIPHFESIPRGLFDLLGTIHSVYLADPRSSW